MPMEITRITRSYDRTIELKSPDGRSIWLKHGATIEANVNPEEAQNLSELYTLLNEIVISEVATKIKAEKAKIEEVWGKSKETVLDDKQSLSDLPKRI